MIVTQHCGGVPGYHQSLLPLPISSPSSCSPIHHSLYLYYSKSSLSSLSLLFSPFHPLSSMLLCPTFLIPCTPPSPTSSPQQLTTQLQDLLTIVLRM